MEFAMEEVWKPVRDVVGYEVSSKARVRCTLGDRVTYLEPQVLSTKYLSVPMSTEGKTKHKRLHLLVLEAFVGTQPEGKRCQFRDGRIENCELDNLYWGEKTCEQEKALATKNKTSVGDVVGKFEAAEWGGYPGQSHVLHWKCRCRRCGSEYLIQGQHFRLGTYKCDLCDVERFPVEQLTTLEQVETGPVRKLREYKKWQDAKNRCKNRPEYREKGIKVCPEWADNFKQFFRDVGPQPGPDFVLDRYPDGAGDYRRGNIRWATPRQSNENRQWATKEPAQLT